MGKYGTKQINTFAELISNTNSRVLVRSLLLKLVPEDIKRKIVRQFNLEAVSYNKAIVKVYGKESLRDGCAVEYKPKYTSESDLDGVEKVMWANQIYDVGNRKNTQVELWKNGKFCAIVEISSCKPIS